MAHKTPTSIISSISDNWLRPYGPMRVLIADGESGLASEEAAQWLDRVFIELKTKSTRRARDDAGKTPRTAPTDHPQY